MNIIRSRREFLQSAAIMGFGTALVGMGAAGASLFGSNALNAVKSFELSSLDRFKVLVATDLHCDDYPGGTGALHTFSDLAAMIALYKPDLLVIDGDVSTDLGNNALTWVVDHLAALNTPWMFARGNHDSQDSTFFHATVTAAANSLHTGTASNPNYRIEIRNKGQTKVLWNLLVIDDSWPTKGFQQTQIDWLNAEVGRIGSNPPPAFAFFHIPLPQFQNVWDNGAVGVKNEAICMEGSVAGAFTAIAGAGMVRGLWCGHDHDNNYYGVLNGVHVAYARKTGYGNYGSLKKGATLITVDAAAQLFSEMAVFADDSTRIRNVENVSSAPECRIRLSDGRATVLSGDGITDLGIFDMQGRMVYSRTGRLSDAILPVRLADDSYIAAYRVGSRRVSERLRSVATVR
jgi:hypothetical protein